MPDLRKIVKVFLASPGDLKDERIAARGVVNEYNQTWSGSLGYQIELVGWEETVSAAGRPQEIINKELDQCELFFGMMWKRWGTPPAKSGPYTSGFEEEFKISLKKFTKEKRPSIRMAFKTVDPELLRDPGSELKKVISFKNSIIQDKEVLFETFDDLDQFRALFNRSISKYVQELMHQERELLASDEPAKSNKTGTQGEKEKRQEANSEERRFLTDFISKFGSETERLTPPEVARFRLIAIATQLNGNDELLLGVHDANLIYRASPSVQLSRIELFSLVESGLENIENNNIPFWTWFKKLDGFNKEFLPIFSFNENKEVRIGAIKAMTYLKHELTITAEITRDAYLNLWFGAKSEVSVKVAALKYLGKCGIESDTSYVQQEIDKGDFQTRSAAMEAMTALALRTSRDKALATLNVIQIDNISSAIIEDIFSSVAHLSIDNMIAGLTHKNQDIREKCARSLDKMGKIPVDKAHDFIEDLSAEIRLIGIYILEASGRVFSEDEARNILVKSQKFGVLGYSRNDTKGEFQFENYRINKLSRLSAEEIELEIERKSPFFDEEYIARLRADFKSKQTEVIDNLLDNFTTYIDIHVERLAARGGEDLARTVRNLKSFLREKLSLKVLSFVAKQSDKNHIAPVRALIQRDYVKWNRELISYMSKHGEWDDIELIAGLLEKKDYSEPFLSSSISAEPTIMTAKAILSLSKGRLSEVVRKKMSSQLLSKVIALSLDNDFAKLSSDVISELLDSDDDNVRRISAVKFIKTNSKTSVRLRLETYLRKDTYYYNVVYWLDFGSNLPSSMVKRATTEAINEFAVNP